MPPSPDYLPAILWVLLSTFIWTLIFAAGKLAGVLGRVLARKSEARDLRVIGVLIRGAQVMKQRERARGLFGAADVDQA